MSTHRFLEDAQATLGSGGRVGITYNTFKYKYKKDWNREFGEDANKAGFDNGMDALASCDSININGTMIRLNVTDETTKELFRVMETAVKKTPYQNSNSNRKAKPAPIRLVKPAVSSTSSSQNFSQNNGWKNGNEYNNAPARPYDPYDDDDDLPYENSSYSQNRNYQPQRNGSSFSAPVKPSVSRSYSTFSEKENYGQTKATPPPEIYHSPTQTNHSSRSSPIITRSSSSTPAIIKDEILIFEENLEETIAGVTKKLRHLFNDVLNYGNEDILPVELINKFIEENDFGGKLRLKQFSELITFFTEWQATPEGLRVVFKHTGKTELPTLIDSYVTQIAIPQNVIEMNSVKIAKIIGTTEKKELIIRLCEWDIKYTNFNIDLRNYYTYFKESGYSSKEFGNHVIDVFAGDYGLFCDRANSRFVRCIVSSVLKSGDVIVHAIDEGFNQLTSPVNIFPIPKKFRKYEPFCLTFEMRMKDLSELPEDRRQGAFKFAVDAMNKKIDCKFNFLQQETRKCMPDYYLGPWTPNRK